VTNRVDCAVIPAVVVTLDDAELGVDFLTRRHALAESHDGCRHAHTGNDTAAHALQDWMERL
jgi:hypothetical protein